MQPSDSSNDTVYCSRVELVEHLRSKKRAQPVSLVTRTPVVLRKARDPALAGGVWRHAFRLGWIAVAYEKLVNNARGREGRPVDRNDVILPFTAGPLWHGAGKHVAGNACLVEHVKSKRVYLKFWLQRVTQSVFLNASGTILEPALVALYSVGNSGFSGSEKPRAQCDLSARESRAERTTLDPERSWRSTRQGLRKPVLWQTIELPHVEAMRMGGIQYLILEKTQEGTQHENHDGVSEGPSALRKQPPF